MTKIYKLFAITGNVDKLQDLPHFPFWITCS